MRDSTKGVIKPARLSSAINDFHRARAQASLQEVTSRLRGKSVDLLSYEEVAARLRVTGKASAGRRPIPLDAIVGSVGRYGDFTRTFLPRRNWDAQRWAHVRAASEIKELPPIDVYQIGDAYFVLDGNHRVSIARQEGVTHIDAVITTVQTRVPLSPDDDPDSLIVKFEYADFLAATRLDQLRPGADVRVSAAGQYAHLENLIEVHRYFREEEEQREIDDREAVSGWYDQAYLPVVEIIREQGILRYFPGRTETDLYVFIATHRAQLRSEMGWLVAPEVAATNLLVTAAEKRRTALSRLAGRIRGMLNRRPAPMIPPGSWSHQRLAARYSGQLFADILVAYQGEVTDREVLAQALLMARREGSRILGLSVVCDDRPYEENETGFYALCEEAGVEAQLAQEQGTLLAALSRRAPLADLVVASTAFTGNGTLHELLQECPRPLLLVPGAAQPTNRVLLYYDGSEKSREALFAATYLAEQWQVELLALLAPPHDKHHATVQAYLELHELPATLHPVEPGWQTLVGATSRHNSDLLVLGYDRRSARDQQEIMAFGNLLRKCDRPLLVCT